MRIRSRPPLFQEGRLTKGGRYGYNRVCTEYPYIKLVTLYIKFDVGVLSHFSCLSFWWSDQIGRYLGSKNKIGSSITRAEEGRYIIAILPACLSPQSKGGTRVLNHRIGPASRPGLHWGRFDYFDCIIDHKLVTNKRKYETYSAQNMF